MTKRRHEVFKWNRGDVIFYDEIIKIQGLGSGLWWEKYPAGDLYSDNVIIIRDIKITITADEGELE